MYLQQYWLQNVSYIGFIFFQRREMEAWSHDFVFILRATYLKDRALDCKQKGQL